MIPSVEQRSEAHPVAASLEELLGDGAKQTPLAQTDGKTGARLERVTLDGRPFVLKYLHLDDDWGMRATGDLGIRPVMLWRDGWLDRLPASIDHAVVAAAWDDRPEGRGAVLLMHDVGEHLLPEGDSPIPIDQHHAFLEHMAQLHATFWAAEGSAEGLLPLSTRLIFFGPRLGSSERARGGTDLVPTQLVPEGWERFTERVPAAAAIVTDLLDEPSPLVAGLLATPQTFVHGDWKAGNLGSHPDGRTILLDWAVPGIAPGCFDLAWYVCLNRARLPESKQATFAAYRDGLERCGIDTAAWWDRQLALSLLSIMLLFGWEKALGDADELAWWEEQVLAGARWLQR
jgi:hypothetical protein